MKQILPDFHVSLSLTTVKISQHFSKSHKDDPEPITETANTNSELLCACKSSYILWCKKPLWHRIKEHFEYKTTGNEKFLEMQSLVNLNLAKLAN